MIKNFNDFVESINENYHLHPNSENTLKNILDKKERKCIWIVTHDDYETYDAVEFCIRYVYNNDEYFNLAGAITLGEDLSGSELDNYASHLMSEDIFGIELRDSMGDKNYAQNVKRIIDIHQNHRHGLFLIFSSKKNEIFKQINNDGEYSDKIEFLSV